MACSVKFRQVLEPFQKQLAEDVKNINVSSILFVLADKTTNIYKIKVDQYSKQLQDNITNNYCKIDRATINIISHKAKIVAEKLNLEDKNEKFFKKKAFIPIKNHKPNFPYNVKCRLIYPTKSNLGKVSKYILKSILHLKTELQQWRNSASVVSWFKNFHYIEIS